MWRAKMLPLASSSSPLEIIVANLHLMGDTDNELCLECKALGFRCSLTTSKPISVGIPSEISSEDQDLDDLYPLVIKQGFTAVGQASWGSDDQQITLQDPEGRILGSVLLRVVPNTHQASQAAKPRLIYLSDSEATDLVRVLRRMHEDQQSIENQISQGLILSQVLAKEKVHLQARLRRVLLLSDTEIPLDAFEVETTLATRSGAARILRVLGRAALLLERFRSLNSQPPPESDAPARLAVVSAELAAWRVLPDPKPSPEAAKLRAESFWLARVIQDQERLAGRLAAQSLGLGVAELFELETLPAENQLLRLRIQCTQETARLAFNRETLNRREVALINT